MKNLIENSILVIEPNLAKEIGLNEAIFLRVLHYWLGKVKVSKDGRKWVFNTISEWNKHLPFFSERTIKRIIDALKQLELIEIKKDHKNPFNRTNFYTINYEILEKIKEEIENKNPLFKGIKEIIRDDNKTNEGAGKIDFEDFIKIYPKKIGGLKEAKKEFDKLNLEKQKIAIEGARIYANQVKNNMTEDKFIKNAKTWLKERYFEDYMHIEERTEKVESNPLVNSLYSKILFLIKNGYEDNGTWEIMVNNRDFFSEEEKRVLEVCDVNLEGFKELEIQKGQIKVFLSGMLEDGRVS